ncbi:DNA-binding domain-containing protein [Pseudorhodoplanes sp.]|uniref:HvfC/BufC N-terminal domain-containing protein n=1 Tax=Pseudorhodoplanes sp. TaxID=1934341 RepID=UPI002C3B100C|nr:DNA-binding domain-containing protein [Pseudorhodoplanes sp.]HWV52473.1 DNA-binding domain-containing protein [Pseudorhodoplanes sp.]
MLGALQHDFSRALLDPAQAVPAKLTSCTARHPLKRFAVYRNNVVVSLVNASRAKFPATERVVGEDFFAAMARVFVTAHPPHSKILHEYGDDFGDFVAAFAPAAEVPYLPDVARLETARTRAYHAADAVPLTATAFAEVDPCAAGALRIALHPSLRIVRSRYPVVTIWAMNAGEAEPAPIDLDASEDALILRPDLEVTVRTLPPGGASFLATLAIGAPLAEAAETAGAEDQHFDLIANLAGLIAAGGITAFSFSQAPRATEAPPATEAPQAEGAPA